MLHLPQRTIARRKKEQRLQADESDRVLRLARISAQAMAALGSEEKRFSGCAGRIARLVIALLSTS